MSPEHLSFGSSDPAAAAPCQPAAPPRVPDGWQNVRRLLAIRLDNVGDVLMTGPALRALRAALPAARITLLASPAGSQAAPLLSSVDEVMVERVCWQDASGSMPQDPDRELALVDRIRKGSFDAAVVFTSFSQSPDVPAYACYLAGVPIRLGQSPLFSGSVLTRRVVPPPDDAHQVDRNLHLVEAAGFTFEDRALAVAIPTEADAAAVRLLREAGVDPERPFAVVAPGASCPARRYDPSRFADVVRRLSTAAELPVVVVGTERESDLASSIVDRAAASTARAGLALGGPFRLARVHESFLPEPANPIASLAGRTSIPELAAIIRRARLLIANDSGPMHVADAVGTPMVILFSGTELERQWRPRRAPATLLRRRTACSPCHRFDCPYEMECLDIEPAEVVRQALHLLATARPAVPARPIPAPTGLRSASMPSPPSVIAFTPPGEAIGVPGATSDRRVSAPPPALVPDHRPTARPARSLPTPGPARTAPPPAAHRRRNETDANIANPDVARPRQLSLLPRPHRA